MIELYQAEWCPYSSAVRERLSELGIPFVTRHVAPWPEQRTTLVDRTGTDSIPVLDAAGALFVGDTVVVFGAGPVGLYAAKSSWLMGAGRVIVIDHLDWRLEKARTFAHAETYNFTEYDDIVAA